MSTGCEIDALANGLTVVYAPMTDLRSVSAGLYLRVGSRYESAAEAGISHFLEHMLFKGCAGWPTAVAIANEVEGRGGYLNASTGQEFTSYWVKIGARYWQRSLELLANMVQRPLLDAAEMDRERGVILDEINMYRDVPEDLVSQLSNEALWGSHPLGREVAGEPHTVAALTAEALHTHHARSYRPDTAVLAIAGSFPMDAMKTAVQELWGVWRTDGAAPTFLPAPALERRPRHQIQKRSSEQAHLQLAVPGVARNHPDRFALSVLNALVGDGMTSRLWQRLREQRGLAYSIGSYVSMFADGGVFGVYGGCDARRLFETLSETMAVWEELQQNPPLEDELQRCKEYLQGRMELSMEDSAAVAAWWARQLAAEMPLLSLDEVLARIAAVSAEDVQRLAQQLWQRDTLTLAYVGPLSDRRALVDWLMDGRRA